MSECHGLNSVRSSVLLWVGGWWRMAAVRRLEAGVKMPVLTGRNSKRRFRVGNEVERAEAAKDSVIALGATNGEPGVYGGSE